MDDRQPRMSRRTVLGVTFISLGGLAGCLDNGTEEPGTENVSDGDTNDSDTSGGSQDEGNETGNDSSDETSDGGSEVELLEEEVASVDFEGSYFDTHLHWQQGTSVPGSYAGLMREHDIGAAVLFSPSANADRDYMEFLKTVTEPGVEYLPFMSAPPPGRRLPVELRELYDGNEKAFWGIGEWKPQNGRDFNGRQLSRLWELAADLDIPVMYHPFENQEGQVETALDSHPDTIFLLHGHQMMNYGRERAGLGPTLPRLLEEYENLYWTMDVATMLGGEPYRKRSASAFIDWYDSRADTDIGFYKNILPELLDAAPDRVLWGTDVGQDWHTDTEVFNRFMDTTERVLEAVPTEHRDPYKYQNALELFGV